MRSGLRNPERAVRGLGAASLILEALVMLLGIQPMRMIGGDLSGAVIAVMVAVAVACVVLSGLMGRAWAWYVAAALQGVLLLAGFLHAALAVLGLLFGAAWLYGLHVRRTILSS
jgi:Protein of unknown function (DUF4233)